MDALSIAATAANGGVLTAATENTKTSQYFFDIGIYEKQIYNGVGKPDKNSELIYGPGICDWPKFKLLGEDMLLKVASFITDPVTTTDALIPSGETSTFRSNPYALAEHTLSRKDPDYVARAKKVREWGDLPHPRNLTENTKIFQSVIITLDDAGHIISDKTAIGSVVYARKPGDGSAREQAASCQRVLGGLANIAEEYATKRYRSNLINWGMLPFIFPEEPPFGCEDFIYIPGIRDAIKKREEKIPAFVVRKDGTVAPITLEISLTPAESESLLAGCLINLYSKC